MVIAIGTKMPSDIITKSERENLEVHVDNCSQRYKFLEKKLEEIKQDFKEDRNVIHERIDNVKNSISDMKQTSLEQHQEQTRTLITSAVAIVIALLGAVITLLSKM